MRKCGNCAYSQKIRRETICILMTGHNVVRRSGLCSLFIDANEYSQPTKTRPKVSASDDFLAVLWW